MNDSTQDEGWWKRLSGGLKRTSSSLGSSITALVTNRPLDPETLDALEDELVRADLGEDLPHASSMRCVQDVMRKEFRPTRSRQSLPARLRRR
jgi:signal recognition particle GTPase